ncbi:MAG: aspartate kinase [Bacilli bacterium]|jgi:aspartate kinase|nr:aspartate kinase [Bacilli bacterium]
MLKVCKFGGSSLADEEEFLKVKKIVQADPSRRIIVVSAPGRRNSKDNKITDLLYLIYQHQKYKVDYSSLFEEIKKRYLQIAKNLHIVCDLEEEFKNLSQKLAEGQISEEELVSRGEYFAAKLTASYLGYQFIDAASLIHFDYESKVLENETTKAIQDAISKYPQIVVPGFYGSYPNGKICLFSRGGSDVTGSYMAKGSHADLYENWTDVSGFFMADPKIIPNPKKIKEISYSELRELSYMGANVIHEETIIPLTDEEIPLEILNTNHPEEGGTLIKRETPDKTHLITGITGKKGFIALTFLKKRSADKLNSIMSVLSVFQRYQVPIEHIPTSIDSFSVVIEKSLIEERFYDIMADLKKLPDIMSISEDDDIALLAVVGRNMVKKTGTSGRILSIFGQEKINIKLIDQGREEINIIIGISNSDFNKSVEALYNNFSGEKI